MRPQPNTYPTYFKKYIELSAENTILEALQNNLVNSKNFIATIADTKANYAYADGKWTVKQVIHHTIDTERILTYRALRFARKDEQQPLGFDENLYAANANLTNYTLANLVEELESVRVATFSLYKSFNNETLLNTGNVALGQTTVLAIGFFMCGHTTHHLNVIKERYL